MQWDNYIDWCRKICPFHLARIGLGLGLECWITFSNNFFFLLQIQYLDSLDSGKLLQVGRIKWQPYTGTVPDSTEPLPKAASLDEELHIPEVDKVPVWRLETLIRFSLSLPTHTKCLVNLLLVGTWALFHKGLRIIVLSRSIVDQWQIVYLVHLRLITTLCETAPWWSNFLNVWEADNDESKMQWVNFPVSGHPPLHLLYIE